MLACNARTVQGGKSGKETEALANVKVNATWGGKMTEGRPREGERAFERALESRIAHK